MQNRLEVLSYWVRHGMPEGAKYSVDRSFNRINVSALKSMPVEDLIDPCTCIYYDPPEKWITASIYETLVKIAEKKKIRCRKQTNSIEDAWNEWYPLDPSVKLIDVWDYEYQYLSNAEECDK